jgi:hypothetical protein
MTPFNFKLQILQDKAKLCYWEDDQTCYVWTKPRNLLTGITKRLRERFYARAPKPQRIKAVKSYGKKGKKGGTLVHEQLEEYANKGTNPKDLDPRVQKIILECRARGWTIIEAEYCVGDKDLHLGTGIDLLCMSPQGQIAVIEIKTGYNTVKYEGPMKKTMKKPFNMMDVSPWAQHQLQLLTTVGLFEKMTGLKADYAEVWVISPPNVEGECSLRAFPLHHTISPMVNTLLTVISVSLPSKKRKYNVKSHTSNKKAHTG